MPDTQRDEKIRDGCEVYARAPERARGGEPKAAKWHLILDNLKIHQSEALGS